VSLGRAGAFFAGCSGPVLLPEERSFFATAQPLGFILFSRNIVTPDQVRRLTADLRAAVGRDAPVMIDQEGGRVARLRPPHWRGWRPPLEEVVRAGAQAPEVMHLRYAVIAAELRALGIDTNCAPCADVAREKTHPVLLNRCYGPEPGPVALNARAVSDGLLSGGVLPVLKHIPGHGAATADSHLELPRVDLPREALEAVDFAPFRALADLPMAMTAHVVYQAIDPAACATNSPEMIRIIREELGFAGLLMSDDISMQALTGGMRARSEAALAAGCDVILHCNGDMAEMEEVAAACGPLTLQAVARAEAALALRTAAPGDLAALSAEWEALMGARADG